MNRAHPERYAPVCRGAPRDLQARAEGDTDGNMLVAHMRPDSLALHVRRALEKWEPAEDVGLTKGIQSAESAHLGVQFERLGRCDGIVTCLLGGLEEKARGGDGLLLALAPRARAPRAPQ